MLITTFVAFPCTDSHDNEFENHSEYSMVDCASAHSDVAPHQETCTPFCMCNCCSTQFIEDVTQIDFILEYTMTECQVRTYATLDQFTQPRITPPRA